MKSRVEILERGQRLAGKAEAAQARLERVADFSRVNIDAGSRRFVKQYVFEGGAPHFGIGQRLFFRDQLAAHGVKSVARGAGDRAGVGAEMGRLQRRFLRERTMARRSAR